MIDSHRFYDHNDDRCDLCRDNANGRLRIIIIIIIIIMIIVTIVNVVAVISVYRS